MRRKSTLPPGKKWLPVFLMIAILCCQHALAQSQITGRVTSKNDNTPVPGVSVLIKGTSVGTVTDAEGSYALNAGADAILVFTSIGFGQQEVTVNGRTTIDIALEDDIQTLQEVVFVGYGEQIKSDLATSISSVSAKDFKAAIITNTDQALQGRTTGVQVVQSSGEPGAAAVVRIRGNNSLTGDNEPLYVIDGFPMPSYREAATNLYGAFSQNGLYGINPNDIESIEVLKDASATAIYGSRGANGVVLITTKSGKKGEGRIELVNKTSVGSVIAPLNMMNGSQYAEIVNERAALQGGSLPFGDVNDPAIPNTNWIDLITQKSFRQDVSLSLSGGSPQTTYYVSGNYLFDKGTIINSDNERGSVRFNLNSELNKWYTLKGQVSLIRQITNRSISGSRGWPQVSGLMDGFKAAPTIEKDYTGFNESGIPGSPGGWFANPVNELTLKTDAAKSDYTILNIENWFTLAKELKLVVTLGSSQNLTRRQIFLPAKIIQGYYSNGQGNNTMANTYAYNANAFFVYDKTIQENHKLNVTLGTEYNMQTVEFLNTYTAGFDIDYFGVNNIGSAMTQNIGSYKEDRTIQSGFLRANYSYKGKYVLNTSVRLDGASPFAANKKYGVFPAAALAWNVNEESFLKDVSTVSNTKLRISYGETGSQAISPYSSLGNFGNNFYQIGSGGSIVTALFPVSLGNQNLSWERTRQFNAGLDFGLANNRINFSFDYYEKTTIDLLQSRALPAQSGFASITDNYGSIRNKGIELSLWGDVVRVNDFKFTSRLNVSHNKNVLLNLGDRTASDYVAIGGQLLQGVSGILTPGEELGRFYGYKVTGLAQESDFDGSGNATYAYPIGKAADQVPGTWLYQDKNQDGIISEADRQVLGKSTPDFIFGWTNDFTWKNLGVSLFFTGAVGNDVLNVSRFYLNNGHINYGGVVFNQTEDWYKNRWTPSNPHNDPRYPGTQRFIYAGVSDANSVMVEDGSFVRLKTLSISYQLPTTKVIKNPKLFFTGTNLFTVTKYTGFDPEVSSWGQDLLHQGIDFGAYPSQRSYTLGFSCNF